VIERGIAMTTPATTPAMTIRGGRHRAPVVFVAAALALGVLLAGCGGPKRPVRPGAGGAKILTVPAIERMVQMGTSPAVIYGEMQRSGTVYNLTTQQVRDLRAVGMPPSLISQMQLTYQYALKKNPKLANTGRYWTQVDNYWYGGVPLGWTRDWVASGPEVGQMMRTRR
jgi:hypothetical protein